MLREHLFNIRINRRFCTPLKFMRLGRPFFCTAGVNIAGSNDIKGLDPL